MALQPTLTIPTGYEGLQRSAASKRKLAEAMMARGMDTPPNMNHWAQVFGQLAQSVAGRRLDKQANTMETEVGNQIRDAYLAKRGAFQQDAGTLQPQDLVAKYGGDPMMAEELKPYQAAMTARLVGDQNLMKVGDTFQREADIIPGQTTSTSVNDAIMIGPDGQAVVNPLKVTAGMAAQGFNVTGYPTTMPVPGMGRLTSAMAQSGQGALPQPRQPAAEALPFDAYANAVQTLGQEVATGLLQKLGRPISVMTPDQAAQLPPGTSYTTPDGRSFVR